MDDRADKILAELLRELQKLFTGLGRRHGTRHPDIMTVAVEAVRSVQWIERRMCADNFVAAFAGLAKVGKSTLLNAMLGEEVTPRKSTPMTKVPIEFIHGATMSGTVAYRQSYRRVAQEAADAQDLQSFIERYATEGGEHASSDVLKVRASIPADILSRGLTLADTPGFGSAQLGEEAGGHGAALKEYLPKVHQLFWVVLFEQGITKTEEDFFNGYLRGICEDVVVTGSDAVDSPSDLLRFKQRFQESLNLNFLRFHFVSGKRALKAAKSGDDEAMKSSGVPDLILRLNNIADRDQRQRILMLDLDSLCTDLGAWIRRRGLGAQTWPLTDWARMLYVARQIDVEVGANTESMDDRLTRLLQAEGIDQ